jgi:hypothetical protein
MKFFLALAALLAAHGAFAATYQVTPQTFATFQATTQKLLKCGDLVVFTGQFGAIGFNGVSPAGCAAIAGPTQLIPSAMVTFDFSAATATSSHYYNSNHVYQIGGTWGVAGLASTNNVMVVEGDQEMALVDGNYLDGTGIAFSDASVVRAERNTFTHVAISADCIDLASVTYGRVYNNNCRVPYDGDAGVHGDGIQLWNVPSEQTMHDIDVEWNTCVGHLQCGPSRFFHVGSTEPQAADHITAKNNVAATDGWAADLGAVTNSTLSGNYAFTVLLPSNETLGSCGQWNLTDNPTGAASIDGGGGNTLGANNTCIPPNISATLASAVYASSQVASLEADAIAQDAIAKASPGSAAAKAASAQAQADVTAAQAIQTQAATALALATKYGGYIASYLAYMGALAVDAVKQAAAPAAP